MPEYVGDVSVRYISRPEDAPNKLEFNHSLMAQCEIDSLRSEIINLQDQRDLAMKAIKRLEKAHEDVLEDAAHWKIEYEIVEARLCGKKHPRDNGIVSDDEIVHKIYKAIELIKSLINQIEYPAYTVDEAVSKMFLMEGAKKFVNEVQ